MPSQAPACYWQPTCDRTRNKGGAIIDNTTGPASVYPVLQAPRPHPGPPLAIRGSASRSPAGTHPGERGPSNCARMMGSAEGPGSAGRPWTAHLTRALSRARSCSQLYLVAPEMLAILATETGQTVRPAPFAGSIELDAGLFTTLDGPGHPARLPFDTVVWACGAPACTCESCPTGQPCPALCSVPRTAATPGAHHLIVAEPGWTADIEEIYLRLRAELWDPEDARRAATRL